MAFVFTAGVSIGAGITRIYKTRNDRDNARETAQWAMLHDTVNIDGHKAVLNRSFINCSKGGMITIIVDPVIAQNAGEIIQQNPGPFASSREKYQLRKNSEGYWKIENNSVLGWLHKK